MTYVILACMTLALQNAEHKCRWTNIGESASYNDCMERAVRVGAFCVTTDIAEKVGFQFKE